MIGIDWGGLGSQSINLGKICLNVDPQGLIPVIPVGDDCKVFKSWPDVREKSLFTPFTKQPGVLFCDGTPVKTKDGRAIGNRPRVAKDDPRSGKISAAIMIFYPKIIFNHTYNAVFSPEGNILVSNTVPVTFAFPLDERVVSDEMIDLAVAEVKKGTFDKAFKQAPDAFFKAIGNLQTGYKYGKYFGPVGGVIGAWIGGLFSWFSGVFGSQAWDTPEEIEAYDNRNAALRNKAGINYHYSTDERGAWCSLLWFDRSRAQYTLLDAFDRLAAKLAGTTSAADASAASAATAAASSVVARSSLSPRARRACSFIGGGRRFPCTKQGARQAVGAARAMRSPLLFQYGRRQIDMSVCLASGAGTQAPIPYPYPQPARATRAPSHRRRRPLRGIALGALDNQNISTLTIQVPTLGAAAAPNEDPIMLALGLIGVLAAGIGGYYAVRS